MGVSLNSLDVSKYLGISLCVSLCRHIADTEVHMTISEKIVGALPTPETGNKLHYFSGAQLQGKKAPSGFAVRVTAAGSRAFVWFHRVGGKGHLETIGSWRGNPGGGDLPVLEAIIKCAERAEAVSTGVQKKRGKVVKDEQGKPVAVDPLPARTRNRNQANQPKMKTISGLLDMWLARYVVGKLRSETLITQTINRLVKPKIGAIGIYDLKRSRVSEMLDEIADENGEVMADRTLAYCSKGFNWFEVNGHDDDFKSPIVRGMQRTKASEHVRKRILTADEIRALWKATEGDAEPFGPMLRFILLTACRRMEAAAMSHGEIKDGNWIIPAARYKTKVETILPLSGAAQAVLAQMPKVKGVDYVFSRRTRPLGGFSQLKTKIDEKVGFSDWVIHDLRRTARSLMSKAGVQPDHAERCLGHLIPGVQGVYDQYEYLDEKRAAFEALARMIDVILNPPDVSNVTEFRKAQ
jgi:integrase